CWSFFFFQAGGGMRAFPVSGVQTCALPICDVSWWAGALETPAERGNSALLTDWMIRTLEVAATTGAPVFLHLALNDPHPPYWVQTGRASGRERGRYAGGATARKAREDGRRT